MALFSSIQTFYTDGAFDSLFSEKGGCGYAFFSASEGRWIVAGWSLGDMKTEVECELLGILAAL